MIPVFLSGPHGSGKTTLINRLKALRPDCFIENAFDIDFLNCFPNFQSLNHFERCLIRLYHRYFQFNYNLGQSTQNQEQTILGSRSIYDSIAYIETYRKLEIISSDDFALLSSVYENISPLPFVIVLNPSVGTISYRLEKRRVSKEREKRDSAFAFEDTLDFLSIIHAEFEKVKSVPNVLYLTDNMDEDINKIFHWIEKINK